MTAPDRPSAADDGLSEFTAYFVKNYPGPDTIINAPHWHAPRIFRAALRRAEGDEYPVAWSTPTPYGRGYRFADEMISYMNNRDPEPTPSATRAEGREESVWEIEARIRATPTAQRVEGGRATFDPSRPVATWADHERSGSATAQRVAAGDVESLCDEVQAMATKKDVVLRMERAARIATKIRTLAAAPPRGGVGATVSVHVWPSGAVDRPTVKLSPEFAEWMEKQPNGTTVTLYTHPVAARGVDGGVE